MVSAWLSPHKLVLCTGCGLVNSHVHVACCGLQHEPVQLDSLSSCTHSLHAAVATDAAAGGDAVAPAGDAAAAAGWQVPPGVVFWRGGRKGEPANAQTYVHRHMQLQLTMQMNRGRGARTDTVQMPYFRTPDWMGMDTASNPRGCPGDCWGVGCVCLPSPVVCLCTCACICVCVCQTDACQVLCVVSVLVSAIHLCVMPQAVGFVRQSSAPEHQLQAVMGRRGLMR